MKKYILIFIICFICISGCINHNTKPVDIPYNAIQTTQNNSNISNLTIKFIDVGQGDSEYIISPTGKTMLIDAGESDEVNKVTHEITTNHIDVVVATHPHSDHIGGMQTILYSYTIGEFIDSGYPHTTKTYALMLDAIEKKNIPFSTVKNGDYIDFDPYVNVSVLNPQPKFFNDINDNSIVLFMRYKNVSILFTGDAELNSETMYAKKLTHVNILKVGHHGSSTSTGSYLISKIHSNISIISVGKDNSYNHPSLSTIQRLEKDNSAVYRTDISGNIIITTDGENYSVVT
jgi:beta-lactamase superfamily II metal-dependent hydrolase